MGRNHDPITLHKYLYANVDPANMVDPTGNFGIAGFSGSFGASLGSVPARGVGVLRAVEAARAISGFFDLATAVRQVMGQTTLIPGSATQFSSIPNINISEAIESASYSFPKAIGTGIGNWSKGFARSKSRGGINSLKAFLLYMPITSAGGPRLSVATPAKVRFGSRKVPIKLVFGSSSPRASGQLFGIGVDMGTKRQLVRMDYHEFNAGHGGATGLKGNEISVIRDGNFHYHVNKW